MYRPKRSVRNDWLGKVPFWTIHRFNMRAPTTMGIGRNESPCTGLSAILSYAGTSAHRSGLQVNILPPHREEGAERVILTGSSGERSVAVTKHAHKSRTSRNSFEGTHRRHTEVFVIYVYLNLDLQPFCTPAFGSDFHSQGLPFRKRGC